MLTSGMVEEIRWKAEAKRSELGFGVYTPIGAKVFVCLDQMGALTLRFPVDDDGLDAFIARRDGQNVVFINTSLPRGKQHFAAAHELYHAWYDSDAPAAWNVSCEIDDDGGSTVRERQANRFAAEFLVPKWGMERFVNALSDSFDVVDRIVLLGDYFEVPAKTVVLRLEEERHISSKDKIVLLTDPTVYTRRRHELGLDGSIEEATRDRHVSPVFRAVMRKNLADGRVTSGKVAELDGLLHSMPHGYE